MIASTPLTPASYNIYIYFAIFFVDLDSEVDVMTTCFDGMFFSTEYFTGKVTAVVDSVEDSKFSFTLLVSGHCSTSNIGKKKTTAERAGDTAGFSKEFSWQRPAVEDGGSNNNVSWKRHDGPNGTPPGLAARDSCVLEQVLKIELRSNNLDGSAVLDNSPAASPAMSVECERRVAALSSSLGEDMPMTRFDPGLAAEVEREKAELEKETVDNGFTGSSIVTEPMENNIPSNSSTRTPVVTKERKPKKKYGRRGDKEPRHAVKKSSSSLKSRSRVL